MQIPKGTLLIIAALCMHMTATAQLKLPAAATTLQTYKPYVVEVKAVNYAYIIPKEIKSGWVTFHFTNAGTKTHYGAIMHLENDITRAEFDSIYAAGDYPDIDSHRGGPGFHMPEASSSVTIYLKPGTYEMGCFTTTAEGDQHAELGMDSYFKVLDEVGSDTPPPSDMQIDLSRYRLHSEGELHTGRQTIRIDGKDGLFDIHLIKLTDSSTLEDALGFFKKLQDPTKAQFIGGTEEGNISYFTVDLEPGSYIWASDEYALWGMYERFKITEDNRFQITENPNRGPVTQQVSITVDTSGIRLPKTLASGKSTIFNLTSRDSTAHLVGLQKLYDGKTKEDYYQWLSKTVSKNGDEGSNPAMRGGFSFGILPLDSGKQHSSRTVGRLSPGTYILVCFSKTEGNLHILDGELTEFRVE